MSIEERMKVVEDLQQKGIFQLKGNISTVAKNWKFRKNFVSLFEKSKLRE